MTDRSRGFYACGCRTRDITDEEGASLPLLCWRKAGRNGVHPPTESIKQLASGLVVDPAVSNTPLRRIMRLQFYPAIKATRISLGTMGTLPVPLLPANRRYYPATTESAAYLS